jgi:hypothetical protein
MTRIPVEDLDPTLVGTCLMNAVVASAAAHHANPRDTVVSYGQHVASPEATFVRDVLFRSTDEIADRWFGGRTNAARIAATVMAAKLDLSPRT